MCFRIDEVPQDLQRTLFRMNDDGTKIHMYLKECCRRIHVIFEIQHGKILDYLQNKSSHLTTQIFK